MKRIIASALLATIVGVASAQQTTIRPDYNGGYVVHGQQGQTTTIRPDYNGGYVVQPQYQYNYRPYQYR